MATKILVKNSGFSTQLAIHVGEKIDGDPLWTARFNATNPEAVIRTHLDFLEDGADILLTNTYQSSVEGYMEYLHLTREASVELIKKTVKLAHTAREKFLTNRGKSLDDTNGLPMIVGSIGPYGAHLHDGSEYSGTYANKVDPETMKKWHKVRIDAILEVGVDGLAVETIPCKLEAQALTELLCDDYPTTKFWLCTQCKDDTSLAYGEPFAEVCTMIWEHLESRSLTENCYGIGANCINPKYVTPLFQSINAHRSVEERIPLVAYPNSGETYDPKMGWIKKEDNPSIELYIPEWVELGVKILGGCCRTYSKDTMKYKEVLMKLNK